MYVRSQQASGWLTLTVGLFVAARSARNIMERR